MALDGVALSALRKELEETLGGSRLAKIRQPGKYDLDLVFKTENGQKPLFLSANPSLPVILLEKEDRESPMTAPNFCMALRKHLQNARLLSVSQIGLERVLVFTFEHLDEMGDLSRKKLIAELMGKYSNLILAAENDVVIDAVRRVPPTVSSVRTILPGSPYFLPGEKKDAFSASEESFYPENVHGAFRDFVSDEYAGLSKQIVTEFLLSESADPDARTELMSDEEKSRYYALFRKFLEGVSEHRYSFEIAFRGESPEAFSVFPLTSYRRRDPVFRIESFRTVSEMLSVYYRAKADAVYRKQSGENLEKQVRTLLERASKKKALQEKQLRDTENREENRIKGELLYTYSRSLPAGVPLVTVENYYDDMKPLSISVDPDLSASDNAKRYLEKYEKQKRTYEAVSKQLEESASELGHLSSVLVSVSLAEKPEDFRAIREELLEAGYLKRAGAKKGKIRKPSPGKPLSFLTTDGFLCLVGKNNLQNDELTMKTASGNDFFFHVKNAPGSHVILKTEGREVPDRAFEEAAALAVKFSSKAGDPKAEVDYVLRKYVKKPSGAKPGFVVYYTNYSIMASPDISSLTPLD